MCTVTIGVSAVVAFDPAEIDDAQLAILVVAMVLIYGGKAPMPPTNSGAWGGTPYIDPGASAAGGADPAELARVRAALEIAASKRPQPDMDEVCGVPPHS